MSHRRTLLLSGLAGLLAAATPAWAEAFPDRPVRLIVPFPPGGSADPIGRILAAAMEKRLGQTMVVENRSGAGGVIGTDAVAKAAPDGYTVGLVGVGSMTVAQNLLPDVPYKAMQDLAPVVLVVGVPQLLVASKASKLTDLPSLLKKARAEPGRLTFGSSGNGNSPHLAMSSLALRTGMELIHVPYRGVAPAITDLMAGRVDLMFADLPALLGPVRDKALVPLALGSAEPSPLLPGVPTLEEVGVTGVNVENWYGVVAPAGTPPDRIAKLQQAILGALQEPDTRERLTQLGVRIIGADAEAFADHLRKETAKWVELIRAAKITIE
ncbi:tripartite tricarboxylate transporter substrate binding protein [Roseomonas sp. M0104]|uniref:Tripartite tricarboxylate transporter substrate binding protein n=1 Tax=Teichococcus coralli TaxID=2545983 RepID=A0A845BDL6_9PROT|nr:tripartite tricarboxylate transporter substrate binding protein [Pseudoroseomonas coralli]MXP65211.1 tripartite tricarboxylate transporter substrate binding protein [Pseudoroseomonas coralli]